MRGPNGRGVMSIDRFDGFKQAVKLGDRETKLFAAVFLGAMTLQAHAQQTTFRGAGGRTIGTATRDSQGTTTFRDARGRTTGTATRTVARRNKR